MGKKLSEKEWQERVFELSNGDITVLDDSFERKSVGKQGQTKLYATYRCNKCQNTWKADINAIIKGHGCPQCAVEIGVKNREKTMVSRYGSASCLAIPSIKEKILQSRKETCERKYNASSYSQTDEFKNKRKATNIEKYGIAYPFTSEDSLEKSKRTKIERYGTAYPLQNEECKEKTKKTLQERYGVDNPMQVDSFYRKHQRKFKYKDLLFDSSWELAYYIFHVDMGVNIIREPETSLWYEDDLGEKHKYIPDFKLPNKTLVEIKGDYWWSKAPESYRIFVQKNALLITKASITPYIEYCENKFGNKKWHENFLNKKEKPEEVIPDFSEELCQQSFSIFQKEDFPGDCYSEEERRKEYDQIIKGKNLVYSKLIRHYHPSIYQAHKKYSKSPIEYWEFLKSSYKDYKKLYINRLKYSSTSLGKEFRKTGIMPSRVLRDALFVTNTAPCISYFKPGLARNLIEKYLSEYSTIFDPFSGFSGRLLGACASGKKYIGQDIDKDHILESREIINFLNLDAQVNEKDILNSNGTYECLFTCPPYEGKEYWSEQSNEIEKSCDEWIGECLNRFACKKYLFVVDQTEKYKDNIVDEIVNRSHFGKNSEYVVLVNRD